MQPLSSPDAIHTRLESLSRLGDPLEALNERIPWELFRPVLESVRQRVMGSHM